MVFKHWFTGSQYYSFFVQHPNDFLEQLWVIIGRLMKLCVFVNTLKLGRRKMEMGLLASFKDQFSYVHLSPVQTIHAAFYTQTNESEWHWRHRFSIQLCAGADVMWGVLMWLSIVEEHFSHREMIIILNTVPADLMYCFTQMNNIHVLNCGQD